MKPLPAVLETTGDGYWSSARRAVRITEMDVAYCDSDQSFGELRVYFDRSTWDHRQLGLIYTDTGFLGELRQLLVELGYAGDDVDYSEQGMQGRDYVSLDVGARFLASYGSKWIEDDLKNG
jgi:hypothetical protein